MKKTAPALGLLVGLLAFFLGQWANPALDPLVYKALVGLRGLQCGSPDIVLVEIDQPSIEEYGKFPWPRSRYAALVQRLDQLGARAIAFGFAFTGETPDDPPFAAACREAGRVYLPVRISHTEMGIEYVHPPSAIQQASAGLGHILLASSAHEMISEVALDHGSGQEGYLALSALVALAGLGIDPSELFPYQPPIYRIGPLQIPASPQRRMRINYAGGSDAFTHLSYRDLLAPDWERRAGSIQGKLVLVGVTARGHTTHYRVPVHGSGGQMTDLLIQANALDTLLRQRFVWAVEVSWWALLPSLAVLAYLWAILPTKEGAILAGSMIMFLLLLALVLFSAGFGAGFSAGSLFLNPLATVFGLLITFALVSFGRIWQRERRLRAYAPPHLVEENRANGLLQEGQQTRAVILFADIKSFTAWAEAQDPQTVYQLMRECIQILADETHKAGGMIDKFTGDGIMAVFGIPGPRPDDAHRAVRAALNMQAALANLNRSLQGSNRLPLEMRIGINLGDVAVGSVGSSLRKDFTVLGDAVNVAARLEQSADPGSVVVSATVFEATKGLFDFTSLGPLYLRNRAQPVLTYQARDALRQER